MDTRKCQDDLASLVDSLCELRALGSLRELLPHYPMHMGLTDEWAGLARALKTVRVQHGKNLPERQMELVVSLQHAAESALDGRS